MPNSPVRLRVRQRQPGGFPVTPGWRPGEIRGMRNRPDLPSPVSVYDSTGDGLNQLVGHCAIGDLPRCTLLNLLFRQYGVAGMDQRAVAGIAPTCLGNMTGTCQPHRALGGLTKEC
jgi:hypothetical protein